MKELTILMDWINLDQLLSFLDQEMSMHSLPVALKMSVEHVAEVFFSQAMGNAQSITCRIDPAFARMAVKADGCKKDLDLRRLPYVGELGGVQVVLSRNSCMVSWE